MQYTCDCGRSFADTAGVELCQIANHYEPPILTHEVVDIDTGRVIRTLPITNGGMLPKYRAYIRPIDATDQKPADPARSWQSTQPMRNP